MANYIGFSTLNACKPKTTNQVLSATGIADRSIVYGKKFRTVDQQLVILDFLNALNIPQGQKVGQPAYGTTLWNFIFEPSTADLQRQAENEIRRVAALDPRLIVNSVTVFSQGNGMLIEVEIAVTPFNQAQLISVFFNQETNVASLLS
jgi:phage baseplate assembly protein W